jgi:hypothetical protein
VVVGKVDTYTLTVTTKNSIPQNGTLKITLPAEIDIINTATVCGASVGGAGISCTINIGNKELIISNSSAAIPASTAISIIADSIIRNA